MFTNYFLSTMTMRHFNTLKGFNVSYMNLSRGSYSCKTCF